MAALSPAERMALLQRSWSTVAAGYKDAFVSRYELGQS